MKIAFIGQKGIPAVSGGVETRVEELATRMAKDGHNVFVYVRNNYTDKNLKKYKGVNLIHLPSITSKNLDTISHTFLATIHALFKDLDVIHYQAPGPSTLSWIIKVFKKNTALVATFNSRDCFHQKWGWFARKYLLFGEYIMSNIPDKTVVISNILKEYVAKKYKKEAIVITNGAKIKDTAESGTIKEWGLRENRYIISVSRLIKHKGIHYLINAFKQLEDTNKLPNNFKLVIAGEGFHTDEYVKYVKFISQKRKNIVFTGSVTGKKLEELFANAYLFVQPSEAEGLSIALLEAMGYGVAPLVSDIPENIEPIGKAGFVFKNKSVPDLARKLAYLLNKPYEVKVAAKMAKEVAIAEHGWDSIAKKYLEVYNDLLIKKQSRRHIWRSKKIHG
ncbi:glycosyltransferase family 4 protein [Patescibacteria group bacterium]